MSKARGPPSDRSMSSGNGNYEEGTAKDNCSEDSDLAQLRLLTKERATKKQIQIDLDRMREREEQMKYGIDPDKALGVITTVTGEKEKKD